MKRIVNYISFIILLLFLTGCFDQSDTSTVRMRLGNIPAANQIDEHSVIDKFLLLFSKPAYAQTTPFDITRIHVAVFNGEDALASESFRISEVWADNTIEFTVPAGAT